VSDRSEPKTLSEMLARAATSPHGVTFVEGDRDEKAVSYASLRQRAVGLLGIFQERGLKRGDHLILFVRQNAAFLDAFWACILGGIVPVPVAVGISDEHRLKLLRITRLLRQPWVFSDRKSLARVADFAAAAEFACEAAVLRERAVLIEDITSLAATGRPCDPQPDDVAFVQFSSGSTSAPKGVVLTHANLVANWVGIATSTRFREGDRALSWMPLTHDMGLIAMHLFMVCSRMPSAIMPTDVFVRRPLLWLEAATRLRSTVLASPNFGYRYYLKLLDDRPVDHLDLSSVRVIYNGAEPISASLVREFQQRMAPARLPPHAVFPVYGLAEASVGVSTPEPGSPMKTLIVDRHRLQIGESVAGLHDAANRDALELVGVGRVAPPCELRIADDVDRELGAERVGHIQIRGSNVTAGYFENPQANAQLRTPDGWTRTGDIGVVHDAALFITGRAKEIIFVNGQNYYPHDVEAVALRAPPPADASAFELGKLVAAGVRRAQSATDELVLFALHRGTIPEFRPVADSLTRHVGECMGLEVAEVVPVRRIPKTTSGKIQRHLLERELLDGAYDASLAELRALSAAARPGAAGADAPLPASAIEAELLRECTDLLEGRRLTPADKLFELGASSLKLIELHERIDRRFPGIIDVTELFDHPTLRDLAAQIAERLQAAGGTARTPT
jgi:acyl-CoA synthetase (AMP-forming)/AMP-acid ligase II/aryl carrier-like protein